MNLFAAKHYVLTAVMVRSVFALELRGSHLEERRLQACTNTGAYGEIDDGCREDSPICVGELGKQQGADVGGDHCSRCIHVFATPLAMDNFQDHGCPVDTPHCLKDDMYPEFWYEGDKCSASPPTKCFNDHVGALRDKGCHEWGKPICANADRSEPVFLKYGTQCLNCKQKFYTPLAASLEALSDQEIWDKVTNGHRIGYWCYIMEFPPPPSVCDHYAQGRPNKVQGAAGVPRTKSGDGGTGCVNEVNGGYNFCHDPELDYLSPEEIDDMCTGNLISNAAAQIRWGIRHGMCNKFCEPLDFCVDGAVQVQGDVLGQVKYINGGASLPAGDYVAIFDRGCMQFSSGAKWTVSEGTTGTYQWYLVGQQTSSRIAELPGTKNSFNTFLECQTANQQLVSQFHHNGGKVGVWLKDSSYNDNVVGQYPPTWVIGRKISCM